MMLSEHFHGGEPHEVELGRATLALAALLDREMRAVSQDICNGFNDADPSERRRAAVANRIVIHCRKLAEQVRCYEHLTWLADQGADIDPDDSNF
jgi:hypothetical protein